MREGECCNHGHRNSINCAKCWRAEARRLQILVDLQPKTEEGIPIMDGDITYSDDPAPMPHLWKMRLKSGETFQDHRASDCERHYKSREAAKVRGDRA